MSSPANIQERTFQFSIKVLNYTKNLPRSTAMKVLEQQLIRSATSIGANVIEGQGGSSRRDFINFLIIARKSAYETNYWLMLIKNQNSSLAADKLIDECVLIMKILTAIILNTKKNSNSN